MNIIAVDKGEDMKSGRYVQTRALHSGYIEYDGSLWKTIGDTIYPGEVVNLTTSVGYLTSKCAKGVVYWIHVRQIDEGGETV